MNIICVGFNFSCHSNSLSMKIFELNLIRAEDFYHFVIIIQFKQTINKLFKIKIFLFKLNKSLLILIFFV